MTTATVCTLDIFIVKYVNLCYINTYTGYIPGTDGGYLTVLGLILETRHSDSTLGGRWRDHQRRLWSQGLASVLIVEKDLELGAGKNVPNNNGMEKLAQPKENLELGAGIGVLWDKKTQGGEALNMIPDKKLLLLGELTQPNATEILELGAGEVVKYAKETLEMESDKVDPGNKLLLGEKEKGVSIPPVTTNAARTRRSGMETFGSTDMRYRKRNQEQGPHVWDALGR